jgi:hypothetical protein
MVATCTPPAALIDSAIKPRKVTFAEGKNCGSFDSLPAEEILAILPVLVSDLQSFCPALQLLDRTTPLRDECDLWCEGGGICTFSRCMVHDTTLRLQAADESSPVHPDLLALVANVLEAVVASNELQEEQRGAVSCALPGHPLALQLQPTNTSQPVACTLQAGCCYPPASACTRTLADTCMTVTT